MLASREVSVDTLREFISAGNYAPGDRLPAERELIGALGMTRNTLRRALDELEREGAIWRHVGKGTFLAPERDEKQSASLTDISRQLTPVKMMRARLCIEPAIAREAAINASSEALNRIMQAKEGAEEAGDWAGYEAQDDAFHHAIAAAADNMLLAALFDQLSQVQRAVAWGNVTRSTRQPPRSHSSFEEHAAIARAIAARDPAGAHDAMRRHIGSVSARLFGEI
ncbi:FadR/GntR family transcriptional regulator [Frigidibacter sp. ROC022]|uniref:FadR/GntR family transcriptional regulator n=1 Tax=Frigidibacter sp. ROC022 TaxID=2971796 RepID=UPI00215A9BC3|nr:FCD domain-containing protein [Frigidibacter sp. ROC022]MCR8725158.1 FCD domain-containing protein [Frigidibacter sp. ROC022]